MGAGDRAIAIGTDLHGSLVACDYLHNGADGSAAQALEVGEDSAYGCTWLGEIMGDGVLRCCCEW